MAGVSLPPCVLSHRWTAATSPATRQTAVGGGADWAGEGREEKMAHVCILAACYCFLYAACTYSPHHPSPHSRLSPLPSSPTSSGIVDSLLDSGNCSVFAYGATGAGKTHTMLGGQDHPGVIFLTMMELYRKIYERKEEISCDVAVSYLEVTHTQTDTVMEGVLLTPPLY